MRLPSSGQRVIERNTRRRTTSHSVRSSALDALIQAASVAVIYTRALRARQALSNKERRRIASTDSATLNFLDRSRLAEAFNRYGRLGAV